MIGIPGPRLSFPLLGLLTLAGVGCGAEPENPTAEGVAPVAVSGGGVTIDVVATQSWNGGFNGAVRIVDTSFPAPITTFSIVFQLAGRAGGFGTRSEERRVGEE